MNHLSYTSVAQLASKYVCILTQSIFVVNKIPFQEATKICIALLEYT
jgi:hypothetical protein